MGVMGADKMADFGLGFIGLLLFRIAAQITVRFDNSSEDKSGNDLAPVLPGSHLSRSASNLKPNNK